VAAGSRCRSGCIRRLSVSRRLGRRLRRLRFGVQQRRGLRFDHLDLIAHECGKGSRVPSQKGA
jgi:hypothetical protein